jgi:hypothetical protein
VGLVELRAAISHDELIGNVANEVVRAADRHNDGVAREEDQCARCARGHFGGRCFHSSIVCLLSGLGCNAMLHKCRDDDSSCNDSNHYTILEKRRVKMCSSWLSSLCWCLE